MDWIKVHKIVKLENMLFSLKRVFTKSEYVLQDSGNNPIVT